MSWILLLIELIPTVLKIILLIRELIDNQPRHLKAHARSEFRAIARRLVCKTKGEQSLTKRQECEDEASAVLDAFAKNLERTALR